MKHLIVLLMAVTLCVACGGAQTVIVKDGKPCGRIVVADTASAVAVEAAGLLRDIVERVSGATLPTVAGCTPQSGDVAIGYGDTAGLTEDGFRIAVHDGLATISSGGDKGLVYGVVELLEDYAGVECFASGVWTVPPSRDITLPEVDRAVNPAFRYRQSQCHGLKEDPAYRAWLRLEEPDDEFAGGMWVHTFRHLLPPERYAADHPEYYSYINGRRRPGNASQLCLTNPEVFEAVAQRVDSIFRANPGRHMISVSQNDGNFTHCACEECRRVDEYEGSPSGNYIRFVNRLAERFPDKQISTLAYLFTMQPPRHARPLPNVNIMLCDIDCKREAPLTDTPSGREFVKALEGWSALTDNLFVWDYGINFDNMTAPFPNFPVLQKNIRLFKDHGVKMHFSQIGGSRGGDFSEMRAWVVSKLMWNPCADTDSLMRVFMRGYYGDAAPFIYDYEKLLEGALAASGRELWIYDSPVSHRDGMLNDACRRRYNELFDKAERAVADDQAALRRVRMSRLPLQYAELEIARTRHVRDVTALREAVDLFDARTAEYGVVRLNERWNSPQEYCELYRSRYLADGGENKAAGASVRWIVPPAERYLRRGETALTDGLYGGTTFVESWVGWEGCDGSFVLDLGEEKEFTEISADFLHQLGAWVLLPEAVDYSVSADGVDFEEFGHRSQPEDRDAKVKFVSLGCRSEQPVRARYVRVDVTGVKTCPSWHYGVGYPAWFFVDEVVIR